MPFAASDATQPRDVRPSGHAVLFYFSYGGALAPSNFVAGERTGSAVLIRAIQPSHGIDVMAARRGPMRRCASRQAPASCARRSAWARTHNGAPLDEPPFASSPMRATPSPPVAAGRRIGITKAVDLPWRFGLAGSPFLSRPIIG